jgi:hypothetical protein
MTRKFSNFLVAVLKPKDIASKNPKRQMEKALALMDEPISRSEMREGKEMLREREQQLEKPPGTLTGERAAPKSRKDFEERVRPIASKRAKLSRQMRTKGARVTIARS